MSKLLFFDLETTGVKFWRNGIHQIGGIVDIDGQEVERFDIRLAPNPAATIELPRIRKWADYGICLSCFDKWKLNGGDIVYINNTSPRKQAPRIKKEHVIHMSNILKGNCDIIKGRKLYVALKKVINSGKTIVLKFDTDQPICMSTRVMNPSFGEIMDEYGKDIFQGNLKLVDVPKGVKDLIVNYIEKYRKL